MVGPNLLFVTLLSVTAAVSATAQGTGPLSRDPGNGTQGRVVVIPAALPVAPPTLPKTDDAGTADVGDPDYNFDLRVVSMRGPVLQTTSTGASQQVIMVTVANYGRDAIGSATLFLDQDTHGRPMGSQKLVLPRLARGAKVTLPVPINVPPDLQGQICFTARLELSDSTQPAK